MNWYRGQDGTGTLSGGRVTLCGSGGGSDCIALRLVGTPDGERIALSRSHDGGEAPDYEARHASPPEGQVAELLFEPHEIAQFALALMNREAPRDVLEAIDRDMARVTEPAR